MSVRRCRRDRRHSRHWHPADRKPAPLRLSPSRLLHRPLKEPSHGSATATSSLDRDRCRHRLGGPGRHRHRAHHRAGHRRAQSQGVSECAGRAVGGEPGRRPAGVDPREQGRRLHRPSGDLHPRGPAVRAVRPDLQGPAGLRRRLRDHHRCRRQGVVHLGGTGRHSQCLHDGGPERGAGGQHRARQGRRQGGGLGLGRAEGGVRARQYAATGVRDGGREPQRRSREPVARVHRRQHRYGAALLRRGEGRHRHRQVERARTPWQSTPATRPAPPGR